MLREFLLVNFGRVGFLAERDGLRVGFSQSGALRECLVTCCCGCAGQRWLER